MRVLLTLALAGAMLAGCGAADDFWFVRERGADMPVWVRGKLDSDKLLVFLHGGPGENALSNADRPSFQALERRMGVVYWDQRLSGSSRGEGFEASVQEALVALLSSPNLSSRRPLFEQYDSIVQSRTVRRPEESDAAVLWLHDMGENAPAIRSSLST